MSAGLEIRHSARVLDLFEEFSRQAAEETAARDAERGPTRRRMPFEPLRRQVELLGGIRWAVRGFDSRRRAQLDRAWERGKVAGELTIQVADRFAVEVVGVHPFQIWGDAWFE